ncbi:MAG: CDP-glycerol glycerophosphotransferase family protein [Lachnospiraceae bacterium]|nr:CDP-glycerol glycerophosphotransferase family protein [Lachnospiraceae bacterium]
MKKINYRITVNINDQCMKLGFRGKLPDDMKGKSIRLQAIFTQRQVDRRFPMEVRLEETELGTQILADADIELPYVFYTPPRHKVNLIFALWCGTQEQILNEQPFPIQKEQFARPETQTRKRNLLKFALCTVGLPFLLVKDYLEEGKNKEKAKHRANDTVYRVSGYNYSPRQRNTDYFAVKYDSYVARTKTLAGNKVLFLSERLPEEGGNLKLIKRQLEADPSIEVTEFINTKTIDALKKKEIRECARKCAEASVIILEDFYPQLHRLSIRRETKVVQLWHACGAFKTFGLTRTGKPGGAPQSSMNHRNYDFVSVSSEAIRGIYAEAFAIPTRKVKALGVPRTDCLFDWEYKKQRREQLYDKYPMLRDSHVVLFAPTFRGDGNKDARYPADAFDVNHFMEAMPDNTVCIVKHHPFVHQKVEVQPGWQDRVLDLTGQDHINDLMLVSDLLITDYSSSVFEAALLELPMLFYAFDEEEYMASRDFYFAYEEMVPGPVEKTFRAMTKKAAKMLEEQGNAVEEDSDESKRAMGEKMDRFREAFLGALDGHSTERISTFIRENYLSGNKELREN